MPIYATCAAHAFDSIEAQDIVETSSVLLLANGFGAILGPVAAASFMDRFGPGGLFVATAGAHLLLLAFVLLRLRVKRPVLRQQRSESDLATTAPTMVALERDERLDEIRRHTVSRPRHPSQ